MKRRLALAAVLAISASRLGGEAPGPEPASFEVAAPRLFDRFPLFKRVMTRPATEQERALRRCLVQRALLPREDFDYLLGDVAGSYRTVTVFARSISVWPGSNSQVAVITDKGGALLAWMEIGGESTFAVAALAFDPARPILEIACHRRAVASRALEIQRYSLKNDAITPLPKR